jgi:hypothetical protein
MWFQAFPEERTLINYAFLLCVRVLYMLRRFTWRQIRYFANTFGENVSRCCIWRMLCGRIGDNNKTLEVIGSRLSFSLCDIFLLLCTHTQTGIKSWFPSNENWPRRRGGDIYSKGDYWSLSLCSFIAARRESDRTCRIELPYTVKHNPHTHTWKIYTTFIYFFFLFPWNNPLWAIVVCSVSIFRTYTHTNTHPGLSLFCLSRRLTRLGNISPHRLSL